MRAYKKSQMRQTLENRMVKDSTNSSTMTIVVATLAASLSGPMICYGFDDNLDCKSADYYSSIIHTSNKLDESVKRITEYSSENYSVKNEGYNNGNSVDLKFIELSNQLAVNQVDLDDEIQSALNKFGKILGAKKPKKNRF